MNLKSIIFILSFNFVSSKQNNQIIELNGESGSYIDDYGYSTDSGYSGNNQKEVISKNNIEKELRKYLFEDYDNNYRPVINYTDNINVNFTLNINSLEKFDQISEKVKFNMDMTYVWYDEYLKWNLDDYNIEYLNIGSEPIWKPDLELYNSASYPELWSLQGATKIYNTGKVRWVLPILYSFSCPLSLKDFPFDTQNCQMDFGSWKMNKAYLDIRINNEENKNNSELVKYNNYQHNEWLIKSVEYETLDMEYLCCPNELWTITSINIFLKRNYHKYLVVIIMTAFLTISALVVNMLSIENYRRTYILVFIPLSIIWLQLNIASKIPVIEYTTLMERFILTSFSVCVICALESGIFYNILKNKFLFLGKNFKNNDLKKFNYNKKKIDFIKRYEKQTDDNSYLYLNLKKKILMIDELFKFVITVSYITSTLYIIN